MALLGARDSLRSRLDWGLSDAWGFDGGAPLRSATSIAQRRVFVGGGWQRKLQSQESEEGQRVGRFNASRFKQAFRPVPPTLHTQSKTHLPQ